IIRSLSREVGGDPIILADRIRNLRESSGNTLEAVTIPPSDAVRVMTIHGSKGLQSKVVILADIFSGRQTNMTMDDRSRLIVGPELFAGNPKPWSNQPSPTSALWNHARKIHMARKNAESRRLLYVGATRAENKLIIVGSTKETSWVHDQGINSPWTYNESLPQLGEMWIESLRQGSGNRGENNSPWIDSSDITSDNMPFRNKGNRIFDPSTMNNHGYLGDLEGLQGIS
ncbi:MAG: 3'-5' exonuclease, partial [Candidatus Poseidoniales archaeon]